jgi:flavorubredoxin
MLKRRHLLKWQKKNFFLSIWKILKTLTDPSDIQYIILDHTEPDHSAVLKEILALAPSATVVGSGNAIRYLEDMLNAPFKSLVVKDGDELDLGNKKLKFISAPNLHWPDTMYTWLEEDKILFSWDSFGAHYCREEMSDDLNDDYLEAFKYYFDVILKPYSKFMLKAIEKIRPLDIKYIGTGHGPVLRENWKYLVDLTEEYAREYIKQCQVDAKKKNILIAMFRHTDIREKQLK